MDMIAAVAAKKLGKFLAKDFREIFGSSQNDEAERLGALARTTIECIARSDALYHTYEHTMLVSMVGRDILRGRTLAHTVQPEDYVHLIVACLLHDIGFVRGVLSGDTKTEFVIDKNGRTVTLPRGASDASLARLSCRSIEALRLRAAREINDDRRRPSRRRDRAHTLPAEPELGRGSDRARAEAGSSRRSDRTARRSFVSEKGECAFLRVRGTRQQPAAWLCFTCRPRREISRILLEYRLGHLEEGMKYLSLTASGRQWIANLHNHIFNAEHFNWQMGPQI